MNTASAFRTELLAAGSDIAGEPYSISVLKEGYSFALPDGSTRADGTISLLQGPKIILVDTGGPWDRDFLLGQLKKKGLNPGDINIVVGTHGHSDHIGNLSMFPEATLVVGCDISQGDQYLPNQLADGRPYSIDNHVSVVPTPGHTGRDVSVLVTGTSAGTVLVAGDLFENYADEDTWRELSENPAVQEVLIPAIHIHLTGKQGCCANRCGMFLSIGFAVVGVIGALYSFSVSIVGLINGPLCFYEIPGSKETEWGTPFANNSGSYLTDKQMWNTCLQPKGVVEFNLGLFSTLLIAGGVEMFLCTIQMVNGLFGCICGTCSKN